MKILAFILAFTTIVTGSFSRDPATAAIHGRVVDAQGQDLPGVTIFAIHTPTGAAWETISRVDGRFNLSGLHTGGPYSLTFTSVDYRPEEITGIRLTPGEERYLSIILIEKEDALAEIVIAEFTDGTFNIGRTGATTNIDAGIIGSSPSISRSPDDLTRLTPQSRGASFAGRDNRFNNYTLDGIIYNNSFGLSGFQLPGGNPLSLESIEGIRVNLAPYDVRQGGFTGAGVNIISKRGDNQFRGAVYAYYNDEHFSGTKAGTWELLADEIFTRITGASVSGPVLGDRLFFFFSIEQEKGSGPGLQKVSSRPGLAPDGLRVSRVPASELDFVREKMMQLYGYETGGYQGYGFLDEGLRINARLDFNINPSNKMMVRVNHYTAFRDAPVNANSLHYNPEALRYRNTSRSGIEAMNFRNSHYSADYNVTSVAGELNTFISPSMANNFRIGYSKAEDPVRTIPGRQSFPFIEVLEFEGTTPYYYMTMGNELFSAGNELLNNTLNITNNFSFHAGRHNLIFGVSLEYLTFYNAFNPVINGFYRFNSFDNFTAAVIERDFNIRPDLFLQGYPLNEEDDGPVDETAFGQVGLYIQNRFEASSRINLTLGIRIDVPFYPVDLPKNPALDDMNLRFTNPRTGENIVPDVSELPGVHPLWSPRIGVNYDVFGDMSLQVRGGTGLFSGRVPFVWISNQVNNNGLARGGYGMTPGQWGIDGNPHWQGFQDDVAFYRPDPAAQQGVVSENLAITDREFKLPQVWRTNIAADYVFPYDVVATLEGIYSLDINSPLALNVNTTRPAQRLNNPYPFPYWPYEENFYDNPEFTNVIMLTNINAGFYASVTAELSREFGEYGNAWIAYTRSISRDYGLEGGSQAASLWPFTVVDDRNDPRMGFSRFDQPNRLVAMVTINTRALGNRFNTGISLVYDGGERGRFSYTYSGSFNDGADRLMYIPVSQHDSYLVDKMADGEIVMTAEQQWEILDKFISQDAYLDNNRGRVAERNGAKFPWMHHFDLRVTQDLVLRPGENHYKLQGFLDIINFGNLINSKWGVGKTSVQNNLMNFEGVDIHGNGMFTINTVPGTGDFPRSSYRNLIGLDRTWSAQIGLRLSLNHVPRL